MSEDRIPVGVSVLMSTYHREKAAFLAASLASH